MTAPITMPVSTGMLVRTWNMAPNATSIPATHMMLEKTVVMVIPTPATLPKRCSMKSVTVMIRRRLKVLAKNRPTRISARAPPQGSAMTPSMPWS